MSIRSFAAEQVSKALGKRGYAITRPRFHEENSIDLRALLAAEIEKAKGRFVVLQVGANDGRTNDPIHANVLSRGWELYAVEPLPAVFAQLQRTYAGNPRVHLINSAVGTTDGEATIYTIREDNPGEGVTFDHFASFSREVAEKHWRLIPDVKHRIEPKQVPVMSLPTLVQQYDIPEIDLLQIDTEGYDFEIVKAAFAAGITPPLLAFEWTHLSKADMWECRTLLIEHGYRWLISLGDVVATRLIIPPGLGATPD